MKYILPALGTAMGLALLATPVIQQKARAAERSTPAYEKTFQQLELFADVMARVRTDYVTDVDDSELIEDAITGMLQSLDPHSSYISPEDYKEFQTRTSGEYGGLGMEVTLETGVVKVISPIDDTPAKRAGILAGDYLTEIDGDSIIGLSLSEAVDRMRGKPGEEITITVIRDEDDPREITLTREVIKSPVVKHEIKEGIGYIRISQFNEKSSHGVEEAIRDLRKQFGTQIPGIILDLRANPGGLLDQSIKVSSLFLDGGEVVSTRGRVATDTERFNAQRDEIAKGVPLIVLIDGASASASEIVAGAIQDRGRGLVLGMTTFGKGSVQSVIPLRGGRDGAIRLTTQKYYTPSGRSIQGTGIDPDIAVAAQPDNGKNSRRLSESKLPNSIKNEIEEKVAEEADEIAIDFPPEDYDPEGDYQLEQAINILKNGQYATTLAALP